MSIVSRMFLGPPGVGKSTLERAHPGRFIDPESSIDWKRMAVLHALYHHKNRRIDGQVRLEQELLWPTIWIEEVLPRIWTAFLLRKDVLMGLVTPMNVEIVRRFLSAFPGQASVFLPPEGRHFLQAWNHVGQRPRTWGADLMGWQNTLWIRLLLQGLAADLGLPAVPAPKIGRALPSRVRGAAAREAAGPRGHAFIEAVPGRWTEVDAGERIVALHRPYRGEGGEIRLRCDRSSQACGKGLHDCGARPVLSVDAGGRPLADWIATDKTVPPKRGKKTAVLFFVGTLAPFHHGHLEALDAAKRHLETRGWQVVGGYASAFTEIRPGRAGTLDAVLGPGERRSLMLQLGVSGSNWLMADASVDRVLDAASLAGGEHPAQRIVARLRVQGALADDAVVTTFWINGKDAVLKPEFFAAFAEAADADPRNPLRMLVVDNRPGEDGWSRERIAAQVPALERAVLRCRYRSKSPTSATAVRAALASADRAGLAKTVGLPLVEAYLMGLMFGETIESLTG